MSLNYIQNIRAIKGLAPTAAQVNKLALNMEWLNSRTSPYAAMVKKNANQTMNFPVTGVGVALTWQTAEFDPYSMFSGGAFTIPSWAKFARLSANLVFSTSASRRIFFYTNIGGGMLQLGTSASESGVQAVNIDSGMVPIDPLTANPTVRLESQNLTTIQVNQNVGTWMCLEVF